MEHITTAIVFASAFGDAANKVIGFIVEVRPAIAALILVSAGCALAFSRGHKAEILGAAALALVILMNFQALSTVL